MAPAMGTRPVTSREQTLALPTRRSKMITWRTVLTGWSQVEPVPFLNAEVRAAGIPARKPRHVDLNHVYGVGPYAMRLLSLPAPPPAHHQFCWELAKGARFDSPDVERRCIVSPVPTDRDETNWHGFED